MAVKTLKDNAAEKEKSDLLQEIQIMQQVGATHPNIVTLLGVCTEKGIADKNKKDTIFDNSI